MADGGTGESSEKELTAKQRKNRKKKEAAKRKKQEKSVKVSPVEFQSEYIESIFVKSGFIFPSQEPENVSGQSARENDEEKAQESSEVNILISSLFTETYLVKDILMLCLVPYIFGGFVFN